MGTIIQFPEISRSGRDSRSGEDATIIILPTVRIERHEDVSADDSDPGSNDSRPRPRRRRSSR